MEMQFQPVERFRLLLPPGNVKPEASAAWKIYPTIQDFIADHHELIRKGDKAGAIESEVDGVNAIDVRHHDADIVDTVDIGEAEFHCAIGRDVEVAQSNSLRGESAVTIAEGGAAVNRDMDGCSVASPKGGAA